MANDGGEVGPTAWVDIMRQAMDLAQLFVKWPPVPTYSLVRLEWRLEQGQQELCIFPVPIRSERLLPRA